MTTTGALHGIVHAAAALPDVTEDARAVPSRTKTRLPVVARGVARRRASVRSAHRERHGRTVQDITRATRSARERWVGGTRAPAGRDAAAHASSFDAFPVVDDSLLSRLVDERANDGGRGERGGGFRRFDPRARYSREPHVRERLLRLLRRFPLTPSKRQRQRGVLFGNLQSVARENRAERRERKRRERLRGFLGGGDEPRRHRVRARAKQTRQRAIRATLRVRIVRVRVRVRVRVVVPIVRVRVVEVRVVEASRRAVDDDA